MASSRNEASGITFRPFPKSPSPNPSSTTTTSSAWHYATSGSTHLTSSRSRDSLSSVDSCRADSDSEHGFVPPEEKRVRQFGEGWIGGVGRGLPVPPVGPPSTPIMPSEGPSGRAEDITPQGPRRTRSPSLPILPSQTQAFGIPPSPHAYLEHQTHIGQHQTGQQQDEIHLRETLNQFSFGHPPHTHVEAFPLPAPQPRSSLLHVHSVPDLERITQRTRAGVRFTDNGASLGGSGGGGRDPDSAVPALRSSSRSMPSLNTLVPKRNVFIHTLPASISTEELRMFAGRYGQVIVARVSSDEGSGPFDRFDSKRHGFVMFETGEEASAFITGMKSKGFMCELVMEDWQTEYKAREDPYSSNVYVVGLPVEWEHDEVDDYMTQFGRVASLRLLTDREGNRRGPVLVSRPQADRAIEQLNGQICPHNGERMQARIADSDNQKGFKKLRSSTSTDLFQNERRGPGGNNHNGSPPETQQLDYLLQIRDKYLRRLEDLDTEIASYCTRDPASRYSSIPARANLSYTSGDLPPIPASPYAIPFTPQGHTFPASRQRMASNASTAWTAGSDSIATPPRSAANSFSCPNDPLASPYYGAAPNQAHHGPYGVVSNVMGAPPTSSYPITPESKHALGSLRPFLTTETIVPGDIKYPVRSSPQAMDDGPNPAKLLWGPK